MGHQSNPHPGEANAPLAPVLGRDSVLVLDGPEHLRQRRLLLPPFQGSAVTASRTVIRDVAEAEVDALAKPGRARRSASGCGPDLRGHLPGGVRGHRRGRGSSACEKRCCASSIPRRVHSSCRRRSRDLGRFCSGGLLQRRLAGPTPCSTRRSPAAAGARPRRAHRRPFAAAAGPRRGRRADDRRRAARRADDDARRRPRDDRHRAGVRVRPAAAPRPILARLREELASGDDALPRRRRHRDACGCGP